MYTTTLLLHLASIEARAHGRSAHLTDPLCAGATQPKWQGPSGFHAADEVADPEVDERR